MMYGSWDIRHDKQSFLSFWVIFCPLTFLTTWKIKILKKWKKKKCLKILSFYTCIPQMMIIWLWFLRYGAEQKQFFVILDYLLPFTPLTTQKIKILKKWKKIPIDIIILHMCTINENHMMYVSRDMERDRHNLFSFWIIFCPFTQKIKILKKWKKCLEISLLHTSVT